jgi:hypothetical protein
MARHKRRAVGPFVRRKTYLSLWRQYQELNAAYAALQDDHQSVLEDHEGLLSDLEAPVPLERSGAAHVPSWAQTEEIPVITTVPLDPDKAQALARNTGLLQDPGGAWEPRSRGTTG